MAHVPLIDSRRSAVAHARSVSSRISDLMTTAFESAEEAWFWFVRCQQVRREGAHLGDGVGQITRPCDPDDIYRAVMSLARRGVAGSDASRGAGQVRPYRPATGWRGEVTRPMPPGCGARRWTGSPSFCAPRESSGDAPARGRARKVGGLGRRRPSDRRRRTGHLRRRLRSDPMAAPAAARLSSLLSSLSPTTTVG